MAADHMHLRAVLAQGRSRLQADKAVADDDHRLARFGGIEQACGVVPGAQQADARQLGAGEVGAFGFAPVATRAAS